MLVLGALVSFAPRRASASDTPLADDTPAANVLVADLSLGVLGLAYERVILDDFSLRLAAQYYRPWYVSDDVFGVGGELRAQFFLYGVAPEGLYLSPGARVYWASLHQPDAPSGLAVSWVLTLGYSFLIEDSLLLRVGIGPQVHAVDLLEGDAEPDFVGVYPIADALAGWAF